MWEGIKQPPNLAARLLDLEHLRLPGASYDFRSGKRLIYKMELSPSEASRLYRCELHVPAGLTVPSMFVIEPDLKVLTGGKRPPHTYSHDGAGIKLCLWKPRYKEWKWSMKLSETYVPWTVEWLWYFEDWLETGIWAGGGEHPELPWRYSARRPKKERRRCSRIRWLTQSVQTIST